MKKETFKYAVTGGLAGAANGLFGAGGGMVLVPLLTKWAGLEERKAFSTSVCIIMPLCLVSLAVYFIRGAMDLGAAWPYLIGGAAGGLIGGFTYKRIPVRFLRIGLGLIIIYGGVRLLL